MVLLESKRLACYGRAQIRATAPALGAALHKTYQHAPPEPGAPAHVDRQIHERQPPDEAPVAVTLCYRGHRKRQAERGIAGEHSQQEHTRWRYEWPQHKAA